MDTLTLLRDHLPGIPLNRPKGDFYTYVKEIINNYKDLIENIDGTDSIDLHVIQWRSKSKRLCDRILDALNIYLEGFPHEAFTHIDGILEEFSDPLKSSIAIETSGQELLRLYRMRVATDRDRFSSRDELFHIPFDQRHKVATQRFSIPGLPSLYLGGSAYVCWEEMGRPDFDKVYMTRFRAASDSNPKVLNIGMRPQFWPQWLEYQRKQSILRQSAFVLKPEVERAISASAILWPLIAACHIKVLERDAAFKPEYIVPQIVLQCIQKSGDFHGVAYSSTHVDEIFMFPMGQMNLDFPARQMPASGYCPVLMNIFEVSEVLSWQMAQSVSFAATPGKTEPNLLPWTFEFKVSGMRTFYTNTDFHSMERKLLMLPISRLSHPV